ncbi:MAG: IS200/IS605 family transposase [Candidatus Diapherotrites archaeon]|nr:IS200/IS605 family transposase [Candidatus Diapherotrites archaeon]
MTDVSMEGNKKVDRRRSSYPLVFVPKYRRAMFGKPINLMIVREILQAVFQKYGAKVHAIELAPDHMHAFVEMPIKESIWEMIRKVKQVSARTIFQAIPNFRLTLRKGRFWSRYTYYESIGKVTAEKIQKYIEEGQDKHYSQIHKK